MIFSYCICLLLVSSWNCGWSFSPSFYPLRKFAVSDYLVSNNKFITPNAIFQRYSKHLFASLAQQNVESIDHKASYRADSFKSLVGNQQEVDYSTILEWPAVKQLIDKGVIDYNTLKECFIQAGADENSQSLSVNFEGFVRLLDILETRAAEYQKSSTVPRETGSSNIKSDKSSHSQLQQSQRQQNAPGRRRNSWDLTDMFRLENPTVHRKFYSGNDDVFKSSTYQVDMFGNLLDELMALFGGGNNFQWRGALQSPLSTASSSSSQIVIDVWHEFRQLAQDRNYITCEDLLHWHITQTLLNNNQLNEHDLRRIVQHRCTTTTTAGTGNDNDLIHIDASVFKTIVFDIVHTVKLNYS